MALLDWLQKIKGKKWLLLDLALIINMAVLTLIMLVFHVYWGDINIIVSDYVSFDINLVFIIIVIVLLPLIYFFRVWIILILILLLFFVLLL